MDLGCAFQVFIDVICAMKIEVICALSVGKSKNDKIRWHLDFSMLILLYLNLEDAAVSSLLDLTHFEGFQFFIFFKTNL